MDTVTEPVAGEALSAAAPQPRRANYFLRHWRGELSLPVSYWVNGAVLGKIVPGAAIAAGMACETSVHGPLRLAAAFLLASTLLSILMLVWSSVGIWRSAGNHAARGGVSGWGTAARISVVLSILISAGRAGHTHLGAQVSEYWKIASGRDPLGHLTATVSRDGRSLLLEGSIGEGSASVVRRALDTNKDVKTVALRSNGGRLHEARAIAGEIQARKLDTYVEGHCESACTLVFLAGRDRGATPNARIGFHSPSFAGSDDMYILGTEEMMSTYRAAGVSDAFVDHVRETHGQDIWYPTRDELIGNHVVTRVSLGGETTGGFGVKSAEDLRKALEAAPLWVAIEKRFPGSIERATQRAWAATERGAPDAEVATAARSVYAGLLPTALRTASDEHLEAFAVLIRTELAESLRVSPEACAKLLSGELMGNFALPESVADEESALMMKIVSAPPRTDAMPVESVGQAALAAVRGKLTPEQLTVLGAMDKYADRPELKCQALIATYDAVGLLERDARHVALRMMFQRAQ